MKKLFFERIRIISEKERAAVEFDLSGSKVAIIGENKVGKSTLIKSLYYTLGAEIEFEDIWVKADVTNVLTFLLDKTRYHILRRGSLFALFDDAQSLIKTFTSVSSGLGPYFSDLFNFKLCLTTSGTTPKTISPPPAFQFLPFYVDQDRSWQEPWNSFKRLEQFSGWRSDLVDYHAGIKPNKYYELTQEINDLAKKIADIQRDRDATQGAQKKFSEKRKIVTFDIDIDSFKAEVSRLILECEKLNVIEDKYRSKLTALRNDEALISRQIDLAERAIVELDKDHSHALQLAEHGNDIPCPTCGTIFENSISNRFGLVEDIEGCKSLVLDLQIQRHEILKEIDPLEKELDKTNNNVQQLYSVLHQKKGDIALFDLVQAEGSKEAQKAFVDMIDGYNTELGELFSDKEAKEEERKGLISPEHRKKIFDYFKSKYNSFNLDLNVPAPSDLNKAFYGQVKRSGSDIPRALLSYYFSIIYTIKEHSSFCLFPIVVDSPNQQDQDEDNLSRIFKFTLEKQPPDTQLVLGSVSLHDHDFKGRKIELTKKKKMLETDQFEAVNEFIAPLLAQVHEDLKSE